VSRVEPALRRLLRPALWALVILPVAWIAWQAYTGNLGAEPIEKLEKETGEWTLRLLAASLAVTPLIRMTGWGWLITQRRFLGLATFFWAFGHLSIYLGLDQQLDLSDIIADVTKHLYVTVGMLAFLLMVPLALTSTKASIRRLGGRKWNRLHQLVYVSAVAGCIHFLWAVKKDKQEPILYCAVFVLLFALRLVLRKGRARPAPVRP
jgi:sulfoxide reductase heme-binding subunit YedZ